MEIFHLLEVNKDGEINEEEFVEVFYILTMHKMKRFNFCLKGCLGDSDLISLLNSGQEDSAGQLSILGGNIWYCSWKMTNVILGFIFNFLEIEKVYKNIVNWIIHENLFKCIILLYVFQRLILSLRDKMMDLWV